MESNQVDDDELKLVKASAALLSDLEQDLPKLLWKSARQGRSRNNLHSLVQRRHLNHTINLIEPFQSEPQLLDAKLKLLLPPIVDAYLECLQRDIPPKSNHVDIKTAICSLLYTFCKVRGYKVIVGFLNNEPRHLETILEALEGTIHSKDSENAHWQVPYILLLWLSHLLLTPFDLSSISDKAASEIPEDKSYSPSLKALPALTFRILRVGLAYLKSPTKAQDAAAAMIVRLAIRPDVQDFGMADVLVKERLPKLEEDASTMLDTYEMLGALRLIARVSASAELSHLMPDIYRTCERAFDEPDNSALMSNAVAKKMAVKIFRNVAIMSLKSAAIDGPLLDFLQNANILEKVIDYLLRSLADKDTPVRYAAAKAISMIVLRLEPEMGHEVIQAILESFKEDVLRSGHTVDFTTSNALKWHGLTLALAHTLFKRSASLEQLPEILDALLLALQFQQRTVTGATLGTNVRDAANFGIWALSRRYTTKELLPMKASAISFGGQSDSDLTVIQLLATQLILSACLDPAGNIRRGSSAALQELVGRHPDQVYEGISLVQTVDYQAVSLRDKAIVDVANAAACLHPMYWQALLDCLFEWRGLGSSDVPSRQAAAVSVARLARSPVTSDRDFVLGRVEALLRQCPLSEVESLHGYTLAAAYMIEDALEPSRNQLPLLPQLLDVPNLLRTTLQDFTPRMLRSEFPASLAQFIAALGKVAVRFYRSDTPQTIPFESMDIMIDRLLTRHEDWILQIVPDCVRSLLLLKQHSGTALTCIGAQTLSKKVEVDSSKSILRGFGRAIALGALASSYEKDGLVRSKAIFAVTTLCGLLDVSNVDWRIIGVKGLELVVDSTVENKSVDPSIATMICQAVHSGLNDYTIDERGDIGSLVRLESVSCAAKLLNSSAFQQVEVMMVVLKGDIVRLSLEKLDRVRLQAAICRQSLTGSELPIIDAASVSSAIYFKTALNPLAVSSPEWMQRSLLEGCMSCAGLSAEPLLQISRRVLVSILEESTTAHLEQLMTLFMTVMKTLLTETANTQPALELLAFLLNMQIPQQLIDSTTFKWLSLLSIVQKSHHKSNDIPKILAAVHVYVGMADVAAIRAEVLKKLINMLKTNPYPRVRFAVAEALWLVTKDESLRDCDWTRPPGHHTNIVQELQKNHVTA